MDMSQCWHSIIATNNIESNPHGSDSPLEIRASPVKFIEYESEPDLDADRASDPTPNNRQAKHTVLPSNLMAKCLE
jgi:hypothetical protein